MATTKKTAKTLHRADRTLSRRASKKEDTPVMRAAGAVAELADQPPLIALSVATGVLGLILRRRGLVEAGARMLASHLLATGAKEVLKRSIDRTRPHSVKKGHGYKLEAGDDRSHDYSSFPSGHTAGAVAVTRAAARVFPDATPGLAAAAIGAGALQLPTGKHYASDVAVGAIIGVVSEWLVDRAVRALQDVTRSVPDPIPTPLALP
ncbi:phosphatase PAP2 family protein [Sphingomonas sp. RS2018]